MNVTPPTSPESPLLPSVDPLARGLSPEELAAIEAAKAGKPIEPKPQETVRWGPLSPVALLALDYLERADSDAKKRIEVFATQEYAASGKRLSDFVEAVVGRRPPLLAGHNVVPQVVDGKTYLVAVPLQKGQS